jgi:hypothetical protein
LQVKFSRISLVVAVAACSGPWATTTHVDLNSTTSAAVLAQAEVFQPSFREAARPESIIRVGLTSEPRRAVYTILLEKGPCSASASGTILGQFWGQDPVDVHLDVPLMPLTNGDYSLAIRRIGKEEPILACGVIKR